MANLSELVFLPLGGLGEIGMNMGLYGIGPKGRRKWLMVDCGVSFAGPDAPGIDLILPDISFIEKERKNLLGIVITHAHEDHFGALADLWPRLGAPVYMTPFAAGLLNVRRLQEPGAPKIPVKVVKQNGRFTLGPFDVELIPVAHSIPESCGLAIRTEHGTVVHTGDWKIDPTPVTGLPTDERRFREIGAEGVLALVADSTNVVRDGESPSEADVAKTLKALIAGSAARVAVTTFASNVARLRIVAEAAAAAGRQVVIAGRAMDRVVDVARELGYLDGLPPFRSADGFDKIPRDRVVALMTGSQGEPRAAMARAALDEHPELTFAPGDRIIFSSRTIPGNEKAVGAVINGLAKQGIEVITDRTHLVHVSGHPRRAEMRKMLEWVKPKIVIPAHGEAMHLTEHAELARAAGVPHVVRAFNGDIVQIAPGEPGIADQAPAGRVYKDGDLLVPASAPTISERRKLSFAGIVSVAVAVERSGEIAGDAVIMIAGLPPKTADGTQMHEFVEGVVDDLLDQLPKAKRRDPQALAQAIERAVRGAVARKWDKKPLCHALVVEV